MYEYHNIIYTFCIEATSISGINGIYSVKLDRYLYNGLTHKDRQSYLIFLEFLSFFYLISINSALFLLGHAFAFSSVL